MVANSTSLMILTKEDQGGKSASQLFDFFSKTHVICSLTDQHSMFLQQTQDHGCHSGGELKTDQNVRWHLRREVCGHLQKSIHLRHDHHAPSVRLRDQRCLAHRRGLQEVHWHWWRWHFKDRKGLAHRRRQDERCQYLLLGGRSLHEVRRGLRYCS
jgi:hypothetical protein